MRIRGIDLAIAILIKLCQSEKAIFCGKPGLKKRVATEQFPPRINQAILISIPNEQPVLGRDPSGRFSKPIATKIEVRRADGN